MKNIALVLAVIFTLLTFNKVNAQTPETIWLTASTTAFKTGETVIVTVNAISNTPIQGFTFQIRYDPACLEPVSATTPISGMNGLSLPQTVGLVDASFASTTPQTTNGILAEVRFVTLGGCQTNLTLESAALAIRNESGFAAPLPNVAVGEKTVALNIDKEIGISATQPLSGESTLLLAPTSAPESAPRNWLIIALQIILLVIVVTTIIVVYKLSRQGSASAKTGSKK